MTLVHKGAPPTKIRTALAKVRQSTKDLEKHQVYRLIGKSHSNVKRKPKKSKGLFTIKEDYLYK